MIIFDNTSQFIKMDNANPIIISRKNLLWLGNIESAQSKLFLNKNNIKSVFNITKIQYPQDNTIDYYQVPLSDSDAASNIKLFLSNISIVDIISNELARTNVLVHCEMGMQRSAAIVAAYLMKYHQMSVNEAVEHITSQRSIAFKYRVTFLEGLYKLKFNK